MQDTIYEMDDVIETVETENVLISKPTSSRSIDDIYGACFSIVDLLN